MSVFAVSGDRRRWWSSSRIAAGAAAVVTLGGGFVAVQASPIVPIEPVRILDTRPKTSRSEPIGLPGAFVSSVSKKLQVTGPTVPAKANGVFLNVTVVSPTAAGFLAVRPGDATGAPSSASLNFSGDSANSVLVELPTSGPNTGQIDITFSAPGVAGATTHILIDVVGYTIGGSPEDDRLVGLPRSELPESCSATSADLKSLQECCLFVSMKVEMPCVEMKCKEKQPDKLLAKCWSKKEQFGVQCTYVADKAHSDCLNEQQRRNASATPYTERASTPLKGQASGGVGGVPGGASNAPPAEY